MKLNKLLDLNIGDIISIVGAGGKTSLMFALAEELKNYKVLVTTSTKIFVPESNKYDFLCIDPEGKGTFDYSKNSGIYILGAGVNKENKILGINREILEKQYKYFDYVLIEADGSKMKAIKGWNQEEPVVLTRTNKTLGVLSIKVIGARVNQDNVHRIKEFMDLTGANINEKITIEHMAKLVLHKQGLFKNSKGEKTLLINQVEEELHKLQVEILISYIRKNNPNFINKTISGSIKNKIYSIH